MVRQHIFYRAQVDTREMLYGRGKSWFHTGYRKSNLAGVGSLVDLECIMKV